MPLKINAGLSRKVGEANYGSRGASINVELEVDSSLVNEPDKLKERIKHLFGLVRTSLAEELNGNNGHQQNAGNEQPPAPGNRPNGMRQATQSQVKAIHAIARSQQINVAQFLKERFQIARPDDLSIKQASQVIDELKAAGNGTGS